MSRTIRLLLLAVLAVSLAAASCGPTASPNPPEPNTPRAIFGPDPPVPYVVKIVYIVNCSDGTSDSCGYIRREIKWSLRQLEPDFQFQTIFCSPGRAVAMPPGKLVSATEENRVAADRFIDAVKPKGKTDPSDAVRKAFALKPDIIYFLTDGPVDPAITTTVRNLNPDKKVFVHAIAYLCRDGEEGLRNLAAENGGEYRFRSEADRQERLKDATPPTPAAPAEKPKDGPAAPQQ